MSFTVFVTSPRAGVPGAISPYTVEVAQMWDTREEAQAFADAREMSSAVVALFDAMPSVHPEWASGEAVAVDTLRAYQTQTWRCIQGHTTQAGWEPPNVLALWTLVPLPGASAWAQPVAYTVPARATYGGRLYQLLQGHTSQAAWTPPAVPALWEDIGPAEGEEAYTRSVWTVVSTDDPDYDVIVRAKET